MKSRWTGCFALFTLLAAAEVAAQEVSLPLAQFEALRARAKPAPAGVVAPPAPFSLEAAEVEIAAGAEAARVTATLTLSLYAEGWQRVAVGEPGSLAATDFGGLEGRVEAAKEGPRLVVRGAGRHRVTLQSVVPVASDATSTRPLRRFELRLPPAAVVTGRIAAPAGVEEAAVEEPAFVTRPDDPAGAGRWRFAAPAGAPLRVALLGKATLPERARLPLRFEAITATAATLSRSQLKVHGALRVMVMQGRLAELAVDLPAGLEVAGVSGPVAGWSTRSGQLVVTPLAPVEDRFAVAVDLTGPAPAELDAPLLVPRGAARLTLLGRAALAGDGLLVLTEPGSARAPSAAELAELGDAGGQRFAVADPARPPRFAARWAEATEVLSAEIDRLLIDVAVGASGRASYRVWAEIRSRGAEQVALTLPPGFTLAEARRDGELVVPGSAAGAESLALPLLTRGASQVVYLAGVVPLTLPQRGAWSIPLPALSAPAARVEVRAVLPGDRGYELADPTRRGALDRPPAPAAAPKLTSALANVSQQIAPHPAAGREERAELFPVPPGFIEIGATWSALSANPSSLALSIGRSKEEEPWF